MNVVIWRKSMFSCLYVAVFWLVTVLNRPWVLAEIFAIQSLRLFCMPSVTPLLSQDWLCLLLLLTESSQRSFQSWQIMYKDFQLFTQLKPYLGPNHNSLLASTQHARRIYQLVNERLVYGWWKIMENIMRGYGHHTWRPQVINPLFSRVMTITTRDIFHYFSPAMY